MSTHNTATIMHIFFNFLHIVKLYHWQTTKYPRHLASDNLHIAMSPLIDKFVEIYISRYGRAAVSSPMDVSVPLKDDESIVEYLTQFKNSLLNNLVNYIKVETDTDLVTIRDDMVASINQALYLFTLN